ncbi:DUF6210 family protein [Streptosporangium saharense]|uniref:DUF6210 family protein n=1 Tax=Streptosporangium saharense TaxID=1706840 RepID=UPI0036CC5B3F
MVTRALRHVFIDPTDALGQAGYFFVIVEAPTGIVYQQQYGGTACRMGEREGYLVPLVGEDGLRHVFEVTLKGAGARFGDLPDDVSNKIRAMVGEVTFWKSNETSEGDEITAPLMVDESRLDEMDEAWIPVITLDGPGILTWPNSD